MNTVFSVVMTKRPLHESFRYAIHGLLCVFREERNIRIHACAAFVALVLALALRFSVQEFVLVVLTSGAVIAGELFNAALEQYSDIVKPRVSGYVEHIKDIAAAGVLVLSAAAALVGFILYAPKLFFVMKILFTG